LDLAPRGSIALTVALIFFLSSQAHADFDDLVILEGGSDMYLMFILDGTQNTNPNPLKAETGVFSAAPYALRIVERCYNGLPFNVSAGIEGGASDMQCGGSFDPLIQQASAARFGPFGYLTGYYYYEESRAVGPLLLSKRGKALIPPVTVAANNLEAQTLSYLERSDNLSITVKAFYNGDDVSHLLSGNQNVYIDGGTATFHDLAIASGIVCNTTCDFELRFELKGLLCTDTWCASVIMSVGPAQTKPPHQLGIHPAFPAATSLSGVAVFASLSTWTTDAEAVFISTLIALSGLPSLLAEDITVTQVGIRRRRATRRLLNTGVSVQFTIFAPSPYAAATSRATLVAKIDSGDFATEMASQCTSATVTGDICSAAVVRNLSIDPSIHQPVQPSLWCKHHRAHVFSPHPSCHLLSCPNLSWLNLVLSPLHLLQELDANGLSFTSSNYLLDSLLPNPSFSPLGTAASCVPDTCTKLTAAPFEDLTLSLSSTPGSLISFTADTCPVPVSGHPGMCDSQGTDPATTPIGTATSGDNSTLIAASPTSPDNIIAVPYVETEEDLTDATVGISSGTRTTLVIPTFVTVRAFADNVVVISSPSLLPRYQLAPPDIRPISWPPVPAVLASASLHSLSDSLLRSPHPSFDCVDRVRSLRYRARQPTSCHPSLHLHRSRI
jgi:hypothetical protein